MVYFNDFWDVTFDSFDYLSFLKSGSIKSAFKSSPSFYIEMSPEISF